MSTKGFASPSSSFLTFSVSPLLAAIVNALCSISFFSDSDILSLFMMASSSSSAASLRWAAWAANISINLASLSFGPLPAKSSWSVVSFKDRFSKLSGFASTGEVRNWDWPV